MTYIIASVYVCVMICGKKREKKEIEKRKTAGDKLEKKEREERIKIRKEKNKSGKSSKRAKIIKQHHTNAARARVITQDISLRFKNTFLCAHYCSVPCPIWRGKAASKKMIRKKNARALSEKARAFFA